MRRQAVRSSLILTSFLLMPVTLYYMSPALAIMGAAQGVVVGSLVIFGLQFLSSLVLGRAFCGWVCPGAGLQEACLTITRKPARIGRPDWVKYVIWGPWVLTIAATAVRAGGLQRLDFTFQTVGGASLGGPGSYVVYYSVLGLIVVLALSAGRRGFCHYACWMAPFMVIGTALRNALRLPGLRLRAWSERCTRCGRCTRDCPMSLPVEEMVAAGRMAHTECILCGTCVDRCPGKAISYTMRA